MTTAHGSTSSCRALWFVALVLVTLLGGCRSAPNEETAAATATPIAPGQSATPLPLPQPSATNRAPTQSATVAPQPIAPSPTTVEREEPLTLLVTTAAARDVAFVEPATGAVSTLEVGEAPWGLALAPDDRAYVATAEGVAVVDMKQRARLALIPYRADVSTPQHGEYRPGGMGVAASRDGLSAYVGVYLPDGSVQLEIIDVAQRTTRATIPIGTRPFQVLVSADDRTVYTIDHDTFTVTAIDLQTLRPHALEVAPLGNGGAASFDKPHYAVLRANGHLLLPFQGHVLLDLDPISGAQAAQPMQANTHQHGAALSPDERHLYIVGTGPAGGATGGPQLTILDLQTRDEQHIPLDRLHERVALSPDGRVAYLSGGYTFADRGWDGITVIDLQRGTVRELPVPNRPLDIAVLP